METLQRLYIKERIKRVYVTSRGYYFGPAVNYMTLISEADVVEWVPWIFCDSPWETFAHNPQSQNGGVSQWNSVGLRGSF